MTALDLIHAAPSVPCPPTRRHMLTTEDWRSLAALLPSQPELAFVALWADAAQLHALFWCGGPVLASTGVEAGLYAALSPARPGAALFERMVADLWGHQAADARDVRPWLDHGTWPQLRPLSDRPVPNAGGAEVPEMLAADGETLGLGPLPPAPAGPAHWRLGLAGDGLRTMEARLGYGHRAVLGLMRGKSPPGAARLAARIDGAATVAHATAFARAVEAAFETPPPARAAAWREAMLATERIAVALHDLNAVAPDPALQQARAGLLAACGAVFGHRLMMDVVRPGGLQAEPGAAEVLDAALAAIPAFAPHWDTGCSGQWALPPDDVAALAPGGVVGRAAGRMDPAQPGLPLLRAGDLGARMTLRLAALEADLALARGVLEALPPGQSLGPLPHGSGEGLGLAPGPQGAVWHWVRLAGGLVSASFAADPAWLHLPAFEAACSGETLESLGTGAASFGLHLGGLEL